MTKASGQVGELVQFPYYCFAPNRRGWNGWLFRDGVIVEKRIGTGKKNYGVSYSVVEYKNDLGENATKTLKTEYVFVR